MTADMLDVTTEPRYREPGHAIGTLVCHHGNLGGFCDERDANPHPDSIRRPIWPAVALVAALTGFLVVLWATGRLG